MKENQEKLGVGRQFSAQKMYVFLKGALIGAGMTEAVRALAYMRDHHKGQYRNDGQPYAVHPLMMACYAISLNSEFIDDVVMAVNDNLALYLKVRLTDEDFVNPPDAVDYS